MKTLFEQIEERGGWIEPREIPLLIAENPDYKISIRGGNDRIRCKVTEALEFINSLFLRGDYIRYIGI